MHPARALLPALLLAAAACSETAVHAHEAAADEDACCAEPAAVHAHEAAADAACCAEPGADLAAVQAVDPDVRPDPDPAAAPADADAPVATRTLSMDELLGAAAPAPTVPDDGTGLPDLGALPEFALVDESGAAFTRESLLGDVWVVDFIFTSCAGPCPAMSRTFVDLQEEGVPARFLSITVDPVRDSPQVLTDYRTRYGADASTWKLLTGSPAELHTLGNEGFRLPVNALGETSVEGMAPMFHSGKFSLVDGEGRVRGYYDYRDKLELRRLSEDAAALRALLPG